MGWTRSLVVGVLGLSAFVAPVFADATYVQPHYRSSPHDSTRPHTTPHDSTFSSRQVSSRPAMSAYDQGIYDAIAEATERPDAPAPRQQNRNSHPYVKSFASDGSSWEMAGIVDASDTLFVDTNSLTDEILYKGVWIKTVGTLKPSGAVAWKGSVSQRVLFDCRSSKYAYVAEIVHNSAGKVVSSKHSQDTFGLNLNWSYAIPSTMIGHIYNFACS